MGQPDYGIAVADGVSMKREESPGLNASIQQFFVSIIHWTRKMYGLAADGLQRVASSRSTKGNPSIAGAE